MTLKVIYNGKKLIAEIDAYLTQNNTNEIDSEKLAPIVRKHRVRIEM